MQNNILFRFIALFMTILFVISCFNINTFASYEDGLVIPDFE